MHPDNFCRKTLLAVALLAQITAGCGDASEDPPESPSLLFVADIASGSIGAFPELAPAPGTQVTGRVISGIYGLGKSLAYDSQNDRLYATNGSSVVVFDRASLASGPVAPSRTITPVGVTFIGPTTLFLDQAADVLYLGGHRQSDGAVVAFPGASTASGAVTPARTMTRSAGGISFFTIDTSRSLLYVVDSSFGHVYANVDSANGPLTAVRTLPGGSGLALDEARDRLYMTNVFTGLRVMTGASAAPASFTIPIASSQFVSYDDANDRLYVGAYDKVYILDSASTLASGAVPTTAVGALAPAGSSIAGFAFP